MLRSSAIILELHELMYSTLVSLNLPIFIPSPFAIKNRPLLPPSGDVLDICFKGYKTSNMTRRSQLPIYPLCGVRSDPQSVSLPDVHRKWLLP